MAKFRLRISRDREPVIRAKADKLEDFEPIFKTLKKKFR